MIASLLLAFREGLEAALIVGIILGYLHQIGRTERRRSVWLAVLTAMAASLGMAMVLQALDAHFEGQLEHVFEGITMLLAVGVLTWMLFWMRTQGKSIKQDLENDISIAIRHRHSWALFSLAFLAVFREGIELALFLTATSFTGEGIAVIVGSLAGLVLAVLVGWAIYSSTLRLNVRRFFDVIGILLLIFAAGLFAHGIHELQEAGWLPVYIEHVWDLQPVLDSQGTIGSILRVLVGYNDNPSLSEVVGYVGYWGVVLFSLRWWSNRVVRRQVVNGQPAS